MKPTTRHHQADASSRSQTGSPLESPWLVPLSDVEKQNLQLVEPAPSAPETDSWQVQAPAGLNFLAMRGIAKAAGAFVLAFAGLQTALMVTGAWSVHWALGLLAALLVGVPGAWLVRALWRARRNSQRIDQMAKLRAQAGVLAAGGEGFDRYRQGVTALAPALRPLFDSQPARLGEYTNNSERLQDLDRELSQGCDGAAHRALVSATRRSAISVAASPFLALDVFMVLAGNLTLVARIAAAYGLPASPFLAAKLLVQVYRQIATLGAIELGTELAGETLSHALLTRLSGRVAQGFSAGLYTYRIGVQAMALCRPLAFSEATKPRPGSVFKDLFKQLEADEGIS